MYYEQLFQTNEAKMNFVKGLIRISKADGGISPEEQTFFIDAARGLGISEEDIAMLPAVMNQKEKISLGFASRGEVLCFLREALQLCMVDDEYSDAERKEIMELAQTFPSNRSASMLLKRGCRRASSGRLEAINCSKTKALKGGERNGTW